MKYQCIIFDWDGTLVDSLGRIVSSMRSAAGVMGAGDRTDQQIKDIIGLELVEAIATLYPELSSRDVLCLRDHYTHFYLEQEREPTRFFVGIPELLADLRTQSRLLAVATGKSRRGLDRVMSALDVHHLFHGTRCADETRGKPQPDMVLELLDGLGVAPSKAVVVGDSHFDLEMANRAGVDAIGVAWGAQPAERLVSLSLGVCAQNVFELRKALGFQ